MKVEHSIFWGPNPLTRSQCVVFKINRAEFERAIRVETLEALAEHSQRSYGYDVVLPKPAGVIENARFLAEWARESLNYSRGCIDHAEAKAVGDEIWISIGFHSQKIAVAMGLGLFSIATSRSNPLVEIDKGLQSIWRSCRRHHPDFQASILIRAAKSIGLPSNPYLPLSKLWAYGQGARAQLMRETMTVSEAAIANKVFLDKSLTKAAMAAYGLPVLPSVKLRTPQELTAHLAEISYPCVAKPNSAGRAEGVTVGITSPADLAKAVTEAYRAGGGQAVIIEPVQEGTDYRILVVRGRIVGTYSRTRSFVIGDGQRTVGKLLEELNAPRRGNMVKARYLKPIAADNILDTCLRQQGLSQDDVPEEGQKDFVSMASSRSGGGTTQRETRPLHKKLVEMVEAFAVAHGGDAIGFDFISEDLSADPDSVSCAFLEANTTPGLPAAISAGWEANEIGCIFIGPEAARVPTRLIVCSSLPDEPAEGLASEAIVAGSFIFMNGRRIAAAHHDGPWAAVRQAETLRNAECITVYATPDSIVASGFPLDHVDVLELVDVELPADWASVAEDVAIQINSNGVDTDREE